MSAKDIFRTIIGIVFSILGVVFLILYFNVKNESGELDGFILALGIIDIASGIYIAVGAPLLFGWHWTTNEEGRLTAKFFYGVPGLVVLITILTVAGFARVNVMQGFQEFAGSLVINSIKITGREYKSNESGYTNGCYYIYAKVEFEVTKNQVYYAQYFTEIYKDSQKIGDFKGSIGDYSTIYDAGVYSIDLTFSDNQPEKNKNACFIELYNNYQYNFDFQSYVYSISGPSKNWFDNQYIEEMQKKGIIL